MVIHPGAGRWGNKTQGSSPGKCMKGAALPASQRDGRVDKVQRDDGEVHTMVLVAPFQAALCFPPWRISRKMAYHA